MNVQKSHLMDPTEQVTKWVENKIGGIINKHLEENVVDENSTFDVETYANYLLEKYFNEDDVENVKGILTAEPSGILYFDSGNSTGDRSIHDSLEFESNELQFSAEEIIKNLESDSEESVKKSLKILETCVEDVINQPSWDNVKDILQKLLNNAGDRELVNLILKVLQKPLLCPKKPQIVSKGFTTIVQVTTNQIEQFNLEQSENNTAEETIDAKEKKSPDLAFPKYRKSIVPEILIKLMWLLIDCQQQIPAKWFRFNEVRFREIIFSFVHLLSSTSISEESKLSGLELLSVLNPKASWCRYWCHTAVGRSLLCSALRKYKHFFIRIVEIILDHVKIKNDKLPPVRVADGFTKLSPKFNGEIPGESRVDPARKQKNHIEKTNLNKGGKQVGSGPRENAENKIRKNHRMRRAKKSSSEWIIGNIPRHIVNEAVFLHSISLVSCLIQFRSGRALFPVQTTTKKRLLSAQDLSLSIIDYLENKDYSDWGKKGSTYTSIYEIEVLKILDILKQVKTHINSSRMSAERQQFS